MVVDRRSLLTGLLTSLATGDKLIQREEYLARHGEDMPEIADWNWDPRMTFGTARSTEADNV
jgi:xylulose-5-phosphate/fructose-6-phosphate phosphoketolase